MHLEHTTLESTEINSHLVTTIGTPPASHYGQMVTNIRASHYELLLAVASFCCLRELLLYSGASARCRELLLY